MSLRYRYKLWINTRAKQVSVLSGYRYLASYPRLAQPRIISTCHHNRHQPLHYLSTICTLYFLVLNLASCFLFFFPFHEVTSAMNLGDLNLRTVNSKYSPRSPALKIVALTHLSSLASRPQLIHSTSKQSVTVSDDYYSFPSDSSSNDGRSTIKYQTPPSQMRSLNATPEALHPYLSIRTVNQSSSGPVSDHPSPVPVTSHFRGSPVTNGTVVKFKESPTAKTKDLTREGSNSHKAVDSDASSTTPGIDDTPYIRFAIDQLTRDEELLGPRQEGAASEASYPVDRIIPDGGLGYFGHGEMSTRHDRQPSDTSSGHRRHPEASKLGIRWKCAWSANCKLKRPMMSSYQLSLQLIPFDIQNSTLCQNLSNLSHLLRLLYAAFSWLQRYSTAIYGRPHIMAFGNTTELVPAATFCFNFSHKSLP